MSRIRVVHIATVDLSIRFLLLNQLRFLQSKGYDVVAMSAPGPHVPDIERAGIRHVAVPMTRSFSPLHDIVSVVDLERALRRERPTIVHTHNPKPGLFGQLAARAAGVPLVVNTIHGFYFHDRMSAGLRAMFIFLEKLAAAQSSAILSQNAEDIATAEAERIAPPGFIELLGNGIDVERFARESARSRDDMRASLGVPHDAFAFGFVGRLVSEKGVHELFEAMDIVRRRFPRARLVVVGPTDREKADALGPEELRARFPGVTATFTGLREDMPDVLAALDALVLPSWREGFPRAPMEAASMGLPVIVTDIRGCRDVCVDGETGFIVRVRDKAALADAMSALAAEPERAAALGAAGRRLALQRFDERAVFRRVEATYRRLLQQ